MSINSNSCIMSFHLYVFLVVLAVVIPNVIPQQAATMSTSGRTAFDIYPRVSKPWPTWNTTEMIEWQYFFRYKGQGLWDKTCPAYVDKELRKQWYEKILLLYRRIDQNYRDFLRICPRHLTHCRDRCRHGKVGGPKFNGICVGQKCVCIRDPDLKLLHIDTGYADNHQDRLWRRVSPIIDNMYSSIDGLNDPAKVLLVHYLRNLRRTVPVPINPNEKFEFIGTTEPYKKTVDTERTNVFKY